MKKMFNEGNQIHNFMSSSGSGTVINYGSGSDFLTSYGSSSGSTSQKVTVPTVPVPVPQHCPYLNGRVADPDPLRSTFWEAAQCQNSRVLEYAQNGATEGSG
jgi:hypothetical protein